MHVRDGRSFLSNYLWNILNEQLLESPLLLGTLENSLRNHRKRPRAIVEDVRVGIHQRPRIEAPLEVRVDVHRAEVDSLR